jgi:hypothetical protein
VALLGEKGFRRVGSESKQRGWKRGVFDIDGQGDVVSIFEQKRCNLLTLGK